MSPLSESGPISVLLVEDEQPTREMITDYILARPELQLRAVARNGEEALEILREMDFDLVFMDIGLPVLSGMEVLEKLERHPYLIFITVSRDHAIEAYELGAVDYLHKPFSQERFNGAVDRALVFINNQKTDPVRESEIADKQRWERAAGIPSSPNGLVITEKEDHHLIAFEEILYISSHERRSVIHTERRDYASTRQLIDLEQQLPPDIFMRIHKQYIVNVRFISRFQYYVGGRYLAFLKDNDDTTLPISRKYAPLVKERFGL